MIASADNCTQGTGFDVLTAAVYTVQLYCLDIQGRGAIAGGSGVYNTNLVGQPL